jgi:hypothetical protein
VVLGELFERIQAAQADRGLLMAELLDCFRVELVCLFGLSECIGAILIETVLLVRSVLFTTVFPVLETVLLVGAVGDDEPATAIPARACMRVVRTSFSDLSRSAGLSRDW